MPTRLRRLCRTVHPSAVLAAAAVLAHVAAAVGFPVVRGTPDGKKAAAHVSGRCAAGTCGCSPETAGGPNCCCSRPKPRPKPKPTCPHCAVAELGACAKPAAVGCCGKPKKAAAGCCGEPKKAAVGWAVGWQVRECRGEGPLGPMSLDPAVPPTLAAVVPPAETPSADRPPLFDEFPTSRPSAPPTPPPRSA